MSEVFLWETFGNSISTQHGRDGQSQVSIEDFFDGECRALIFRQISTMDPLSAI
jgi:hypothetical protein